jgi:phosphate transport system protein
MVHCLRRGRRLTVVARRSGDPNEGSSAGYEADSVAQMPFKLGVSTRSHTDADVVDDDLPERAQPLAIDQPLWPRTMPEPHEIDRLFAQVFALVGEGIAGATHALLAGDRDAAKELVKRDELVDRLIGQISTTVQQQLVHGETTAGERSEYVAILRMLPDLERNGDLAEHIARRAARGLGAEMSARSRGLVERMGEVATTIWRETADAFVERAADAATSIDDLDDELDDLHVTLTAELVAGTMPLPVAIELAMVARFYERFGDHAVNLARRLATLVVGGPEPVSAGPD